MAVEYETFVVESRLPFAECEWVPVHIPQDDDDRMTREDADAVVSLYKRSMLGREYRVRSVWKTEYADEDIPF